MHAWRAGSGAASAEQRQSPALAVPVVADPPEPTREVVELWWGMVGEVQSQDNEAKNSTT